MIFLFTLALACSHVDEFKIMCKARCNFDKDRSHWVTKKGEKLQCHCGNPVTMDNANLKIPRDFKIKTLTNELADDE